MKRKIVAVSLVAVALAVVVREAAASQDVPGFDVAGIRIGSPVADVLALLPEEDRPVAARWRTVELVVPVRLFELEGQLSVRSERGRVANLGLFLNGEPERVAAAVTELDRALSSAYERTGDPSWRVFRAEGGDHVAQLHVFEDSLALMAGDFH